MAKITVKRPIALGLGSGQREFQPGMHELTEAEMLHWAIPGLVHAGAIVIHSDIPEAPKELNYPSQPPPIPAKEVKELDYSMPKIFFPGGGTEPMKIEEPELAVEKFLPQNAQDSSIKEESEEVVAPEKKKISRRKKK